MSETTQPLSTLDRVNSSGASSDGDGDGDGDEYDDEFRREPSYHEDQATLNDPQFSKYIEYYNDLKAVMEEENKTLGVSGSGSGGISKDNKPIKKEHSSASISGSGGGGGGSNNNSVSNNMSILISAPTSNNNTTTTTTTTTNNNRGSTKKKKLHKMVDYDAQFNEPNITLVVSQMTRDGVDPNDIRRFAQALRAQDYYAHMFTSRSRSNSHASDDHGTPITGDNHFGSNQMLSAEGNKMSRPTSIPDMKKLIEASSTSLASMDSQSSFEEFFRVNLDERTPSVVMKSVFSFYDDNKDGILSSKNFKRLLYKMGIRESDLRHFMMLLADKDNNDQINWNDFYTWVKNDQAQRWIRENDRFFTFVMIAKIFMKKHERNKKKESEYSDGDEEDEKSDKPTTSTKKSKKADYLGMKSSFMEESISEQEFLEIGKELGFFEAHLHMLWQQINDFQSNEIRFHQWFQYLEPVDVSENYPAANPNLSSITGLPGNRDITLSSSNENLNIIFGLKNDQV